MSRAVAAIGAVVAVVALGGCSDDGLTLKYQLKGIVDVKEIYRLETIIGVDPVDPRMFDGERPYQPVGSGVGYELKDVDGSGQLSFLITHDAAQGFEFSPGFSFRLLPPRSSVAPPLFIHARALGATEIIAATTEDIHATFGDGDVPVLVIDLRCRGGSRCTADQSCCSQGCTMTDADPMSCGGCGMSCGDAETCSGAKCRCAGGSGCTEGKTCFSDSGCYDLQNDPYNCGAKGKTCNPGETCSGGTCGCGAGAACGSNTPCCAMAGGAQCAQPGVGCACGAGFCDAPNTCCDQVNGTCVNLSGGDNANCGGCGKACVAPSTCSGGACKCNGIACSGGDVCCASGCAALDNDPLNCGQCGKRCAVGELCMGGQCHCGNGAVCGANQICCGSVCKDKLSDPANCGSCGHTCSAGEGCSNGQCNCNGGPGCPGTQYVCCQSGCDNTSLGLDPMNNPAPCGSCSGPTCVPPSVCLAGGTCATDACGGCMRGNTCDPLKGCHCGSTPACTGFTPDCCFNSYCTNFQNDPNNCGNCNNHCPSGVMCISGVCQPPDMGDDGGPIIGLD